MKVNVLFLAVILILCTSALTSANAETVRGNGNIITKEVNVGEYNSIKLGPGIECNSRFFDKKAFRSPVFNYSQNKGNNVISITVDENVFSLLEINVSGNELVIGVKRGNKVNPSQLIMNGTSADLNKISVSGCIDLNFVTDFNSDKLDIQISGASDVKMNHSAQIRQLNIRISGAGDFVADDLTCDYIESSVSGAGDVTLEGKADRGKFSVSGAGDIKAFDFIVKDMECRVSGAGDIKVTATNTLDATVSGTGDIHYKGEAKVNTRVSGFGDIKKVK